MEDVQPNSADVADVADVVVLVSSDPDLQEELRRIAAASALPLEIVPEVSRAMLWWRSGSVVLVGVDCVEALAQLGPTRRSQLSVVAWGTAPPSAFRAALTVGATEVVELPTSRDWLGDALAGIAGGERTGRIIGVIGSAGGLGATSLACALAGVAAQKRPTSLVDLDPVGVGIERVSGYEGHSATTWETLDSATTSARALRAALPTHRGVSLIGFGGGLPQLVEPRTIASVLEACPRAFEVTVIDIPRGLVPQISEAVSRCDLLVAVCIQSEIAASAGRRLIAALHHTNAVAVVRSGPRLIDPVRVGEILGCEVLIAVPDQRQLDEATMLAGGPLKSRGTGLRRAAESALAYLGLP